MQWWYNFVYVIIDGAFALYEGVMPSMPTFEGVAAKISTYARIANSFVPVKELFGLVPYMACLLVLSTIIRVTRNT